MACLPHLSEGLNARGLQLLITGQYSDFTLEIIQPDKPPHIFKVHRAILVIASPFWESAIKWATDGVLKISQFNVQTIQNVLHFIYTSYVAINNLAECENILEAADFFNMPGLQKECNIFIKNKLSTFSLSDFIKTFNMIHIHNNEDAKIYCLAYIEDNTRLVFDSEEFLSMDLASVQTLLTIQNYFCPEEYLIRSVLRWAQNHNDTSDLKSYLIFNSIYQHFRLHILFPESLDALTNDFPGLFEGEVHLNIQSPRSSAYGNSCEIISELSRGGENNFLSSKIIIRRPPVVLTEEFIYVGESVMYRIFCVQIEARTSSICSSMTTIYEEMFSVTINNRTEHFEGTVTTNPGGIVNFSPPIILNLNNYDHFNILITLRKTGIYWKNSNFSQSPNGLMRTKGGIIKCINNMVVKPPSPEFPS